MREIRTSKGAPRKLRVDFWDWLVFAVWLLTLLLAWCAAPAVGKAPQEWPQDKAARVAEAEALRIAETYQIDYTKGDAEVSWEEGQ